MEKPLHVQVAEVLGWERTHARDDHAGHPCGDILLPDPERMRWKGRAPGEMLVGPEGCKIIPRFDEDWSATGPLIERFRIALASYDSMDGAGQPITMWSAILNPGFVRFEFAGEMAWDPDQIIDGPTPLIAVCNLILALKAAGPLTPPPA